MNGQEQPLVNRVANSSLTTLNLEEFFPPESFLEFDLKEFLFKALILREKDFRLALKTHDWSQYKDNVLLVYCSSDAIIPLWAYMLVAAYATPFAKEVFQGSQEEYLKYYFQQKINALDFENLAGKKIVIKGCGDLPVPAAAYTIITNKLQPIAQSIMYGEPCSTVPIYKQKRSRP